MVSLQEVELDGSHQQEATNLCEIWDVIDQKWKIQGRLWQGTLPICSDGRSGGDRGKMTRTLALGQYAICDHGTGVLS